MSSRLIVSLAALAALLSILAATHVLPGCRSHTEPPRDVLRLVDLAAAAEWSTDSPTFDAAQRDVDQRGERLVDGKFGALPPANKTIASGARMKASLRGIDVRADAAVHVIVVPCEAPTACHVRVTCSGTSGASLTAFTSEWNAFTDLSHADEKQVAHLMLSNVAAIALPPSEARAPSSTATTVFERIVRPGHGAKAVVLGIISASRELGDVRIEMIGLSAPDTWLATLERRSSAAGDPVTPNVRMAVADSVSHESILLGAPSWMKLTVTVPARHPRFSAEVTAFFANDLEVKVEARAGSSPPLEAHVACSPSGWTPLVLDLEPLAGKQIELVVSTTCKRGKSRMFVAVGMPALDGETGAGADARPDVLLVSIDTLRRDHVGLYGSSLPLTPFLDSRAGELVRFDTAITAATWTLPSHSSMLSGQYPDRHGVVVEARRLSDATPLLEEDFRRNGWRTLAWTGDGYVDPSFGFDRGFERFTAVDPAYPDAEWVKDCAASPKRMQSSAEHTRRSRADLLEFLADPRGGPRFVFLHTYAAHNYVAPKRDFEAIGAPQAFAEGTLAAEDTNLNLQLTPDKDPDARKKLIDLGRARYAASVRVTDRLLQDVFAAIEKSGRLGRTIIVITADHGEELCENGKFVHGDTVCEEVIRVPLLMRVPNVPGGPTVVIRGIPDVVSEVDIVPTLRELCRLAPAGNGSFESVCDGRSLVPLLSGGTLPAAPALVHQQQPNDVQRALRGERLKLVEETNGKNVLPSRLFAVDKDPQENDDLAATRADDVERMSRSLASLVQRLQDKAGGALSNTISADLQQHLRELGYGGH